MPRRLLLVGWETADWKILHPLLDAGEMPALNRLVNQGASGALTSVQPPVPAIAWTSVATGKRAWQHGILHSMEIPLDGGAAVPVTAGRRRSATLWEILARANKRSLVVGWPATHGDQPSHACVVSDRYSEPTTAPGIRPWPTAVKGTYWPEEIRSSLDRLRVSPEEIGADLIARYIPEWRKIDQKRDRRIGQLRVLLAADFSFQTAIASLMTEREWDFAAVRFPAAGPLGQIFQAKTEAVKNHYRTLDMMLAKLMDLSGKDAAVMVVSASGIFAAGGPDISPDALLHGASLLDVVPTILAWFGLSIGDDMEGRVLIEAFSHPPAIERARSWDASRTNFSQANANEAGTLREETDWNLAQSCLEAGRHEQALPILRRQFLEFPERAENGYALVLCQLALGRTAEAEEIIDVVLETIPGGAASLLLRAELALSKRDFRSARPLVEAARQLHPTQPDLLRRLGLLLLRLREWNALGELANEALRIDENDAIAWLGLAEVSLRKGDAPKAAEAAQRALGLRYFLPEAHFVLARSLVAQGLWAEARAAMETLVKLQPNHRTAPAYLKRLPGN